MSWIPDVINGLFELLSGVFLWNNVMILVKHKSVRGVSVITTFVFATWGVWNLFYYPHLNQWFSFVGGLNVVSANATWVYLAIKYKENKK